MKNTFNLVLSIIAYIAISGFFWLGNKIMLDGHYISGPAFKICSCVMGVLLFLWMKKNIRLRGLLNELPYIIFGFCLFVLGLIMIVLGAVTGLPPIIVFGALCWLPITSSLINHIYDALRNEWKSNP
jgi:hypothetical protein